MSIGRRGFFQTVAAILGAGAVVKASPKASPFQATAKRFEDRIVPRPCNRANFLEEFIQGHPIRHFNVSLVDDRKMSLDSDLFRYKKSSAFADIPADAIIATKRIPHRIKGAAFYGEDVTFPAVPPGDALIGVVTWCEFDHAQPLLGYVAYSVMGNGGDMTVFTSPDNLLFAP
jgi:hypothetical protein